MVGDCVFGAIEGKSEGVKLDAIDGKSLSADVGEALGLSLHP
jgi:hypothetical protein